MILGLIVCIVFLFVTLTSMERRMASVESELKENSKKGAEHNLPENEKKDRSVQQDIGEMLI